MKPSPPLRYEGSFSPAGMHLNLEALGTQIAENDAKVHALYQSSRKLQIELMKAKEELFMDDNVVKVEGGGENEDNEDGNNEDMATENVEVEATTTTATATTKAVDELFQSLIPTVDGEDAVASRIPRDANLSWRVEDYVRYKAYQYFFTSGAKCLPPSHCNKYATDEEYLAGVCMGLSQDLVQYSMGRATVRDVDSVVLARNLVQELQTTLLKFDFRNGPLRRRFDGTKYALKTLETLLYELSVTGASIPLTTVIGSRKKKKNDGNNEPDAKRMKRDDNDENEKSDDPPTEEVGEAGGAEGGAEVIEEVVEELVPIAELDELRKRMEHRDELREKLIKTCRDGQKAAKQSIFALHRGDKKKAFSLLSKCESCIQNQLVPIIKEEPQLRNSGSFSAVLEEYVEGKLFYAWLYGNNNDEEVESSSSTTTPSGMLLPLEDFTTLLGGDNNTDADGSESTFIMKLKPYEYLGGLCDLTGEVGRFAVQRGTVRDIDGVKLVLSTNKQILHAISTLQKIPSGVSKKMDMVRKSVEKIERMLYELSLSEATGRRMKTEAQEMPTNTTAANNDNNDGDNMDTD